jgi:hypothetical protein
MRSSILFASLAIALFVPSLALADEPTRAAAAPAAAAEQPQKVDDDADMKRFAIAANPLGIAIGRYSIQGEYMLARHHAVTANPFFAYAPVTATVNGQEADLGSLTGFGGELGYRFYSGSKGMTGFYAGPSFIFASYTQSAPSNVPNASSDSFTAIGGAVDIGGQAVIGSGFVLGGGFGLQYTANSKDINTDNLNLASAVIAGGGIRPRFLLSAGYAF